MDVKDKISAILSDILSDKHGCKVQISFEGVVNTDDAAPGQLRPLESA